MAVNQSVMHYVHNIDLLCILLYDNGTVERRSLVGERCRDVWGWLVGTMWRDAKSLGLFQEDAQSRNKWRRKVQGTTG